MPKVYSEDLKWWFVYLYVEGYSYDKIAQYLYVSTSLVWRVLQEVGMYVSRILSMANKDAEQLWIIMTIRYMV